MDMSQYADETSLGTRFALLALLGFSTPTLLSSYWDRLGLGTRGTDIAPLPRGQVSYPAHIRNSPLYRPPPVDLETIRTKFHFTYSTSRDNAFVMVSPWYTVATHMFHHRDVMHFVGNMFSVFSSAVFLDLGFVGTLVLFFGGGVAGASAHVLEWCTFRNEAFAPSVTWTLPSFMSTDSHSLQPSAALSPESSAVLASSSTSSSDLSGDIFSNLFSTVQKHASAVLDSMFPDLPRSPTRTISLLGSSAGAYSLMGAEITRLLFYLHRDAVLLREARRTDPRRLVDGRYMVSPRVKALSDQAWRTAGATATRVAGVAVQVYATWEPESGFGTLFGPGAFAPQDGTGASQMRKVRPAEEVGHSAHLGGFLFGVWAMVLREGVVGFWRD